MRTRLLIVSIAIFSSLSFAQSGWHQQNPTNRLRGVNFTDSNTGTTVGYLGTILRTTNGGTNWTSQTSGTTNEFVGVSFTDANTGTAVGAGGVIVRTTNGGTNWTNQSSGTTKVLFGVSFTDANIGTIVGELGLILRTTNGGSTWTSQTSGTTNDLLGVTFTDANTGTAVGIYGTILRTTNGGATWANQTSGTANHLYGVSFTNANAGTTVGYSGTILRTTNGGATWTSQTSGTANHLHGVSFIDDNTGTVVGIGNVILRTTNGGTNWTSETSGITNDLHGISFTDANNGTAVGDAGLILRTINGGVTWTSQTSGKANRLRGVNFTDSNTGTTVGYLGTILRTTNGGTNWTSQTSGTTNEFVGVSFTDANTGTAVGAGGVIVRTTNGGTNWTNQSSGTTKVLFGVSFTDANIGTIVGELGLILRTTNGGSTWTSQTSGTTNDLLGVTFTDANTGTAVGIYGTILRTTNGGATWANQTSGTANHLYGVSFTNANAGTTVGYSGTILRTTNGGATWTSQTSGTANHLHGVSFIDDNTGTVVGIGGVILHTTNGGTNWTKDTSGTTTDLHGVSCTDANNGTAVGDAGTILRKGSGSSTPPPVSNPFLRESPACFDTTQPPTTSLTFQKTYGGSGDDNLCAIKATPDGGYIAVGSSNSCVSGDVDISLVKIDSLGTIQWTRNFGDAGSDNSSTVMVTNNGYIIFGSSQVSGKGYDVLVTRTDLQGHVLWKKTYGGTGDDNCRGAIISQNGDYILVGTTTSYGAGGWDCLLMKLDTAGNVYWMKTYGTNQTDQATAVYEESDGSILVTATTYSSDHDMLLFKTDASGNLGWSKKYTISGNESGYGIVKGANGDYYIVTEWSYSSSLSYATLYRVDPAGNLRWTKTYSTSGSSICAARSIVALANGDVVLGGKWEANSAGTVSYGLIMKTDSTGNVLWCRKYGSVNTQFAYQLFKTSDGGLIVGGQTNKSGAGGYDGYIVRTDAAGIVDSTGTLVTPIVGNPVVTPSPITLTTTVVTISTMFTLDKSSLNFQTVPVGGSATQSVIVTNTGSGGSFTISGISTVAGYSIVPNPPASFPITIPSGASKTFDITFTPISGGTFSGNIVFSHNAAGGTANLSVTGIGISPTSMTVVPDSFMVTLVTGDTTTQTMVIGNTGAAVLYWNANVLTSASSQMSVMEAVNSMRRIAIHPSNQTKQASMISTTQSAVDQNWTAEKAVSSNVSILQGGIDIAIIYAEDLSWVQDVQSKLLMSGQFNSITLIDGRSVTPTLTQLQAFKAVLVFSDYSWLDRVAMGNVLAAYIETGGGVVCGVFATAGSSGNDPGGNFSQYQLMTFGSFSYSTGSLGTVHLPSHALMQGVTSFEAGMYGLRPVNTTISSGSVKVADWNDGSPLIVYKDNVGPKNAHRVDLGFFPVSSDVLPGLWLPTTDGAKIMANALLYVGGGAAWITVIPDSASIAPGNTQNINVKFNAKNLMGGDYRQVISIGSNDPSNNPKRVPAKLHVIGMPVISVSPDSLDAGVIYIGSNYSSILTVKNSGTDTLRVTNIVSNLSVFSPSIVNCSIAPGKDQNVMVMFAPTDTTRYSGILTIMNNDSLHPAITIVLQGRGAYPPVISVAPSSLSANLLTGQVTTRMLTISNTGSSNLIFNAIIGMNQTLKINKSTGSIAVNSASFKKPIQASAEYRSNRVIVKFKKNVLSQQSMSIQSNLRAKVERKFKKIDAELWNLSDVSVEDAINRYKNDPSIEYIEPDYIVHTCDRTPNDPMFAQLWGMQKISAPAAWDKTTGTDVVVGDIDTGIDTNHVDLKANLWTNPGEIPNNGIDDDGNGYIDDVRGWNFVNNTNNVFDDHSHGTHTAGTIAAVGNNGVGVTGVCWSAKIMALKFLDASGSGTTSAAVSAIEYATQMHARLTSNSWGGGGYSQALYDAIKAAGDEGILFVAAAGNNASNTDVSLNYPSCYDLDNIISVASTTSSDEMSSFSNYGLVTVDLGAPGSDVYSTLPGNTYGSYSGTSMATPHVSGTAGLILSLNPMLGAEEVKDIILSSADAIPSLAGKTVTGGRLNAAKALQRTPSWIKLNSLAGTVAPGSSVDLMVTFDATNMVGGDYHATIGIHSNDPVLSVKDVPASLHVTGNPIIQVTPDTVKSGVVYIGSNHVNIVKVRNTGSDILNINNITSNLSVFTPSITSFSLMPGADQSVEVAFVPTDTIACNGILTIASNDSLHPIIAIVMQGQGAFPPSIEVSPEFLSFVLHEKDSTSAPIAISNTGRGPLIWSVESIRNSETSAQMYTLPATMATILNPDKSTTMAVQATSSMLSSSLENLSGKRIGIFSSTYHAIISADLASRGARVYSLLTPLSSSMLDTMDVLAIDDIIYSMTTTDISALRAWIQKGNALLIEGDNSESMSNINTLIAGTGINDISLGTFSDGIFTNIAPHQITDGVDTIVSSAYGSYCTAASPAFVLVRDNSAQPHIVISSLGTGRILVACNEIAEDFSIEYGDNRTLVNRAFDWLAGGGAFVSVDPTTGTIAPGSSQVVTVKANASTILPGLHQTILSLHNNDPLHNPKDIPISLQVIGKPVIAVIPDTLKYNPAYVGVTSVDTLHIKNIGSDVLQVGSIIVSDTAFHPNKTSFAVPSGGQGDVQIRFAPSTVGVMVAAITITCNDSSSLTKIVPIRGEAFYAPIIKVIPDSLAVSVKAGDSTTTRLTISNRGLGMLQWYIPQSISAASRSEKTLLISRTDAERNTIKQNQAQTASHNTGTVSISPYSMKSLLASSGTIRVLLWTRYSDNSPGGETENTMNAIRQYRSDVVFDTTMTISPVEFALRLAQTDVFIIPEQELAGDLTSIGASFSSALNSFVQSGRTAIVLDFISASSGSTSFLNGTGLLTINNPIAYSSLTAVVYETTSPLVAGVAPTFTGMNGSNYHSSPNGRKIVSEQSTGNNVVTQRDISSGRVIYIGMDFYSYNNDMARLLANAVSSSQSGQWISEEPASGTLAPGASQDVTVKCNGKGLQPGNYRSTISIASNDPMNNPKKIPMVMHIPSLNVILSMDKGWNLVSVPLVQINDSASVVFHGKYGTTFGFNSMSGEYYEIETLSVGDGYWVFYKNGATESISGDAPSSITIACRLGWNLIGSRNTSVQVSSLVVDNGASIYADVFRYDAVSKSYKIMTVLNPGAAIWVYVTGDCTLTIP